MRNNFIRGIVTGSVLGTVMAMMFGSQRKIKKGVTGMMKDDDSKLQAGRVVRNVGKTVNDFMKR
ncbi:MAG: hypothetical protein K9L17_00225 [Clostridiales bacterium]|nr:hypothetical protein [Clostridiales bacterium]MCF8021116.1 hypothetical protein [Clostridiales bacterium]